MLLAFGSMCLIIVHLVLFFIFSYVAEKAFEISFDGMAERVIYGMFWYFILFQAFALPLSLMQSSLNALVLAWCLCMLISCIYVLLSKRRQALGDAKQALNFFTFVKSKDIVEGTGKKTRISINIKHVLLAGTILAVLFSVIRAVNGWDTLYYVSLINEAVETNTLYKYEANNGILYGVLPVKSIFSSFYLSFAVWAKLLGLHGRMVAHYCIRGLCVIMSTLVTYNIGRKVFLKVESVEVLGGRIDTKSDERALDRTDNGTDDRVDNRALDRTDEGLTDYRPVILTIIWLLISIFATGNHTGAFFMFVRGYEAKGWCVNIVLAMLVCQGYELLKVKLIRKSNEFKLNSDDKHSRDDDLISYDGKCRNVETNPQNKLWMISLAAVPISMSSLATAPAGILVFGISSMILCKDVKSNIGWMFKCLVPGGLYILAYLLLSHFNVLYIFPW